MRKVREYLQFSCDVHNQHQRRKWLLDAACLYCEVLQSLKQYLAQSEYASKGLKLFYSWLSGYIQSEAFALLEAETTALLQEFDSIHYAVEVETNKVSILPDLRQMDFTAELLKTFKSFSSPVCDDEIHLFSNLEMCVLETKMAEILMKMHPKSFEHLELFAARHNGFLHEAVSVFERELQFYLSILSYISDLETKGFQFCIPHFAQGKQLKVTCGYDLALAGKVQHADAVIANDYELTGSERIFVVSGPNQGGKTTFARAFGQTLFLAGLGCPVPARSAELFLADRFFTHFSREENPEANTGRLKDDIVRMKAILKQCTSSSILIINELFSSTTSLDAYTMGKRVLEAFLAKDCVVLYITHIHELAEISPETVSLTAQVDEAESAVKRTYHIRRQRPDGRAYANTIAEKYHLTYQEIKERINHEDSFAI